jgi:hypothetical protein
MWRRAGFPAFDQRDGKPVRRPLAGMTAGPTSQWVVQLRETQ